MKLAEAVILRWAFFEKSQLFRSRLKTAEADHTYHAKPNRLKTMNKKFTSCCLRLMLYTAFICILGRIAAHIGPPHYVLAKIVIGVVVGLILVRHKVAATLKELRKITDKMLDDMFQK